MTLEQKLEAFGGGVMVGAGIVQMALAVVGHGSGELGILLFCAGAVVWRLSRNGAWPKDGKR
jgi:hypothetical protein